MRFEKLKKGRKDSKVTKFIDEFIETNYDRAEIFNEEDYETDDQMVAALRFAIKSYYKDKINISKTGGRIFMFRIDKGAHKWASFLFFIFDPRLEISRRFIKLKL